MKNIIIFAVAVAFAVAIACSGGGYGAPSGSIIQDTTLNLTVPAVTNVGAKTGKACVSGLLGIMSSGDGSVMAAAKAGGVQTVKVVDYQNNNLLGSVLAETCTIVRGD